MKIAVGVKINASFFDQRGNRNYSSGRYAKNASNVDVVKIVEG